MPRFRALMVALALLSLAEPGCKADKKKDDAEASSTKVVEAPPAAPPPPAAPAPAPAPAPAAEGVDAGLFTLPKARYAKGEDVIVTYKKPVVAAGSGQHWITLAKPTDVESAWGIWHYVASGATTDKVQPPTTGSWEVRFHDVYPKWSGGRILAKATITVE